MHMILRRYGALLLGALLYYLAARAGMAVFSLQPSNITLLWLPSGIGLVMCVMAGWRAAPWVVLASFAANYPGMTSAALPLSYLHTAVAALADTGAVLLAARLLQWRLPDGLKKTNDLFVFVLWVCLLPTTLSALILSANLVQGSYIPAQEGVHLVYTLVSADSLGILLIYPLYLVWTERPLRSFRLRAKALITAGMALLSVELAFSGFPGMIYLLIPALLYLALQEEERSLLALLLIAVVTIVTATKTNPGPFDIPSLHNTHFLVLAYLFTATLVALGMMLHQRELRASYVVQHSLQYQVGHDHLTGLYNRGLFFPRLEEECHRVERSGDPFALAILDVDHFKSVNDDYGHLVGDAVLVGIAQALRRDFREVDVCARIGGEEFCVMFPSTPLAEAARAMERLRKDFAVNGMLVDGRKIPLTVSIGLGSYRGHGESIKQLLGRVDGLLYRAKRAGRNRLVSEPLTEVTDNPRARLV